MGAWEKGGWQPNADDPLAKPIAMAIHAAIARATILFDAEKPARPSGLGYRGRSPENLMSTGKFCWFDLMSTDVPAARAFYTELFGWDIREHNAQYAMIHDRAGRGLGGMMAANPGQPSAWLPYVTTDDIAITMNRVRELGGKVFMEHDAPEVGKFAIYADPQGAALAAIQLKNDTGNYPREKGENHIAWSELNTTDPAAALAFHAGVFDWKSESWGPDYILVGDEHSAGITRGQPGVPSNWLVYVNSQNTDATVAKVESLGGKVMMPGTDIPNIGRFAVFADPTGGVFAVMQSFPKPE